MAGSKNPPVNPGKFELDLNKILTNEVGHGKFQMKAIALCGLLIFCVGYTEVNYIFTAARIRTRCIIPECETKHEQNFSPSWISNAVPTHEQSFDNCHRFLASNSSHNATPGICQSNMFDRNSIVKCTEYVYEHNNSAVYDFDLACDEWRWFFIGASQVLGTAISLPIAGIIADRWGRRIAISIFSFNFAWINTMAYFSSSYTTFILCYFFGSFFGISTGVCVYVLALELVAPKERMVISCIFSTCYSLGSSILGLVAWLEPNWRLLILMIHLPMFICIPYYWLLPESVCWLISKNRLKESKKILIAAAKMNGKTLSEETVKNFPEDNVKEESKTDGANVVCLVFKHKAILLRCVLIPIWWITALFVNNSLSIASVGISGNKYVNFSAVAAVTIPAYWASLSLIDRTGRKPVLIGVFWISGASQLAYIFIPKDYYALSLCVYLLGKFCIATVIYIMYVFTSELFPTSHRSSLVTATSMVGRLGAFIAPVTPALSSQVWEHLPYALSSGLAFFSGLLLFLVPETGGITLAETMEDAANLGKNSPSQFLDLFRRILLKKRCYSLR